MRELLQAAADGHEGARLAVDLFCYRVRKSIAACAAALEGADCVAFTAGIGENAPEIRADSCQGLEFMGIEIDAGRNATAVGREERISSDGSRVDVWTIPTNESLLIARETAEALLGRYRPDLH
jgi:acetate kinase